MTQADSTKTPTPIQSIIAAGTKMWLDSVHPDLVGPARAAGLTGATSNPKIISDIVDEGHADGTLSDYFDKGMDDEEVAWAVTDQLVRDAQEKFIDVWRETSGNDGYVSFELDPLLEDPQRGLSDAQRAEQYIALGKRWSEGHENRMIKVPATSGGLAALEELAAAGVTLNVTLIFSERQYTEARDAIWHGAQRFIEGGGDAKTFKSVYSIFISRLDVYTTKHAADLGERAQGSVGILNAKWLWNANQAFWADKSMPLQQEIIFASTGTKLKTDSPDKYVAALVGSDIQTNPPETNDAVQDLGKTYRRTVDIMPADEVQDEIDKQVDFDHLEQTLIREGVEKFASPHKQLLSRIGAKRGELQASGNA